MKQQTKREIISVLYPDDVKCVVCGKEIRPNRYGLCGSCTLSANNNFCLRCGRHKVGVGDYCGECSDQSLYFDEARSAVNYDGNAKSLVRRLKYGGARYLAAPMSEFMLDVLLFTDWSADCITFVPVHPSRLKKRGYNQAELLAKSISDRIDLECVKLVEKTKKTVNQAKLDKQTRMSNLAGSFGVVQKPPAHVILVDDVMTTGSTANECAKVLKRAGASVVYVLTFASVPERPMLDKQTIEISEFRR